MPSPAFWNVVAHVANRSDGLTLDEDVRELQQRARNALIAHEKENEMVDISHMLSTGNFLKAQDLVQKVGLNKDCPLTVASTEIKQYEEGDKVVLGFHGTEKVMGLNVTNLKIMARLFGPDNDNWVNKVIHLYATMVEYRGDMVAGLRIRTPEEVAAMESMPQPAPQPAPQPMAQAIDDEVPF